MQPDPAWFIDNVLAYTEPGRHEPLELRPVAQWCRYWRDRHADCEADPITNLARKQGFAVLRSQFTAFGRSVSDLRREVRRGRWWQPCCGTASPVVVDGSDPIHDRRRHCILAAAQSLRRPTAVVSGRSAAIAHGLPSPS